MIEKRKFTRVDWECPVQLKGTTITDRNFIRNSFSKNISLGGLQIISFDFYPVNEKVKIKLFSTKYATLFEVVGKVAWIRQFPCQKKYRVGIELVDTSKEVYRKIKDLIETKILKHFHSRGDNDA